MQPFKEIINKYFNRNKKYLLSKNILHEMNGVVLTKTNNAIFNFHKILIEEVKNYCIENNYEVDKIVFVSSYDANDKDKNCNNINIKMKGDSKITIIKEDNKIVALVTICEYVEIREI